MASMEVLYLESDEIWGIQDDEALSELNFDDATGDEVEVIEKNHTSKQAEASTITNKAETQENGEPKIKDMYTCDRCDYSTKDFMGFITHKNKHIKDDRAAASSDFTCGLCDFDTQLAEAMVAHIQSHLQPNPPNSKLEAEESKPVPNENGSDSNSRADKKTYVATQNSSGSKNDTISPQPITTANLPINDNFSTEQTKVVPFTVADFVPPEVLNFGSKDRAVAPKEISGTHLSTVGSTGKKTQNHSNANESSLKNISDVTPEHLQHALKAVHDTTSGIKSTKKLGTQASNEISESAQATNEVGKLADDSLVNIQTNTEIATFQSTMPSKTFEKVPEKKPPFAERDLMADQCDLPIAMPESDSTGDLAVAVEMDKDLSNREPIKDMIENQELVVSAISPPEENVSVDSEKNETNDNANVEETSAPKSLFSKTYGSRKKPREVEFVRAPSPTSSTDKNEKEDLPSLETPLQWMTVSVAQYMGPAVCIPADTIPPNPVTESLPVPELVRPIAIDEVKPEVPELQVQEEDNENDKSERMTERLRKRCANVDYSHSEIFENPVYVSKQKSPVLVRFHSDKNKIICEVKSVTVLKESTIKKKYNLVGAVETSSDNINPETSNPKPKECKITKTKLKFNQRKISKRRKAQLQERKRLNVEQIQNLLIKSPTKPQLLSSVAIVEKVQEISDRRIRNRWRCPADSVALQTRLRSRGGRKSTQNENSSKKISFPSSSPSDIPETVVQLESIDKRHLLQEMSAFTAACNRKRQVSIDFTGSAENLVLAKCTKENISSDHSIVDGKTIDADKKQSLENEELQQVEKENALHVIPDTSDALRTVSETAAEKDFDVMPNDEECKQQEASQNDHEQIVSMQEIPNNPTVTSKVSPVECANSSLNNTALEPDENKKHQEVNERCFVSCATNAEISSVKVEVLPETAFVEQEETGNHYKDTVCQKSNVPSLKQPEKLPSTTHVKILQNLVDVHHSEISQEPSAINGQSVPNCAETDPAVKSPEMVEIAASSNASKCSESAMMSSNNDCKASKQNSIVQSSPDTCNNEESTVLEAQVGPVSPNETHVNPNLAETDLTPLEHPTQKTAQPQTINPNQMVDESSKVNEISAKGNEKLPDMSQHSVETERAVETIIGKQMFMCANDKADCDITNNNIIHRKDSTAYGYKISTLYSPIGLNKDEPFYEEETERAVEAIIDNTPFHDTSVPIVSSDSTNTSLREPCYTVSQSAQNQYSPAMAEATSLESSDQLHAKKAASPMEYFMNKLTLNDEVSNLNPIIKSTSFSSCLNYSEFSDCNSCNDYDSLQLSDEESAWSSDNEATNIRMEKMAVCRVDPSTRNISVNNSNTHKCHAEMGSGDGVGTFRLTGTQRLWATISDLPSSNNADPTPRVHKKPKRDILLRYQNDLNRSVLERSPQDTAAHMLPLSKFVDANHQKPLKNSSSRSPSVPRTVHSKEQLPTKYAQGSKIDTLYHKHKKFSRSTSLNQYHSVQNVSNVSELSIKPKHKPKRRQSESYVNASAQQKSANTIDYQNSSAKKVYRCEFCEFSTDNSVDLKTHSRCKHTEEEKVYMCDKCDYIAYRQSKLAAHEKVHEEPDEFEIEDERLQAKNSIYTKFVKKACKRLATLSSEHALGDVISNSRLHKVKHRKKRRLNSPDTAWQNIY